MTTAEQLKTQQDHAALAEMRRMVIEHRPPTAAPLEAFGPWAQYIGPLRRAYTSRGVLVAHELFLSYLRLHPDLVELMAHDPQRPQTSWTMADLLAAKLPQTGWIVPGLLPAGLSTLAGRPKMGKSWLALQIACAVGAGGRVLDRTAAQGPVLYLALEDSPHRLQERVRTQGASPADVYFALEWRPLGAGGLAALRAAVDKRKYRLVVIDTLSRALGHAGQLDSAAMTLMIGELQDLCRATGTAVLMVDHHKKPLRGQADPIDDILGSTGKAAVVDAALGLYCERGRHEATLRAIGRDMAPVDLYLRWDGERCCWQAVGEAGEVRIESLQAAILDAIRELNEVGEVSSTTAIARHLHKDAGNVSRELADLIQAGRVVRGERDGRVVPYFLLGHIPPPT